MDHDHPADPYSPPGSDLNAGAAGLGQGVELAERGTRLWAITVDGLLLSVPILPAVALGIYLAVRTQAAAFEVGAAESQLDFSTGAGNELMILLGGAAGLGCLCALGIAIYQWILISRTGQSLGKKWNGIRIERVDGGPIGFGSGVLLRNWVPKLIGSVPYLGMLFHLADCLFIFRDDRRCIHDHIAGTRVVRHLR